MQDTYTPQGIERSIDRPLSETSTKSDAHDTFCISSSDTVWEYPDGIPFDLPRD